MSFLGSSFFGGGGNTSNAGGWKDLGPVQFLTCARPCKENSKTCEHARSSRARQVEAIGPRFRGTSSQQDDELMHGPEQRATASGYFGRAACRGSPSLHKFPWRNKQASSALSRSLSLSLSFSSSRFFACARSFSGPSCYALPLGPVPFSQGGV